MVLVMKEGYKSSVQRLAKLFQQSRDMWKDRALEKQKKLRSQAIRIRDLEKSRDLWKSRAQKAEAVLRQAHREVPPRVSK